MLNFGPGLMGLPRNKNQLGQVRSRYIDWVHTVLRTFVQRGLISKFFALRASRFSTCAQYVTLQIYFSHPSLVTYFFTTPPMKLIVGLQKGKNPNSKPPVQIIMTDQSKTKIRSQIIFITLYSRRCRALQLCLAYQPQLTEQICRRKTTFLSQTGKGWYFFIRS